MLLSQIRQNGFTIELDGNSFSVSPPNKITDKQRAFLKANKSQIMEELLSTTVYTLWGVPIQIQARDATHQAWLIAVNHQNTTPASLTGEFTHG